MSSIVKYAADGNVVCQSSDLWEIQNTYRDESQWTTICDRFNMCHPDQDWIKTHMPYIKDHRGLRWEFDDIYMLQHYQYNKHNKDNLFNKNPSYHYQLLWLNKVESISE